MATSGCFLTVLFVLVNTVLSSERVTRIRHQSNFELDNINARMTRGTGQEEGRNLLELIHMNNNYSVENNGDGIPRKDAYVQRVELFLKRLIKEHKLTLQNSVPDYLNLLAPVIISSLERINSSSLCANDTVRLMSSVLYGEKWTIPFVDAAGKPGPSLTKGWLNFVGNYDQCKSAMAPHSTTDKRPAFKGEYCVLTISSTYLPFVKPKIGLCVPDVCSDFEIFNISKEFIGQFRRNITVNSVECLTAEHEVTKATVIAIILLIVIGGLVVLGTVYDVMYMQKWNFLKEKGSFISGSECTGAPLADCKPTSTKNYETITEKDTSSKPECGANNRFVAILLAFSAFSNGKKVLTVSQTSESLGSIHGIRYLSICWVVLGHTYLFGVDYSINKTTELPVYFDRWTFDVIANALLSVDTFFTLTGLLTSFLTIKEMKTASWKLNWPLFYFHRFWRLTPPYMFVIVIFLGLTQYIGEGPLWSNEQPVDKKTCDENWWRNLLYINNFYDIDEMCMPHSWYLPNDMQFYLVGPLMLILLHVHRMAGIITCLLFLFASWVITGVLSSVNDWTPTYISIAITREKLNEYLNDFYFKPWCRIGPFIIGILAGYLLTHVREKPVKLKLKWWVVALGWFISTGSLLTVIYGLRGDISGDHPSSTGIAALYNAIARSVWGASICWIVIACDAGYGGPVNTFLSWSLFVVLGRLTYMTYLIHPYIMKIFFQNMGFPFYMSNTSMPIYFIGLLIFSNFAAFVFMLGLESPMIGLETILLTKKMNSGSLQV